MITVLAIDALELTLVNAFNCEHLKQVYSGKTDISEFSEPRTMVLWCSFMTGKNMETEVLSLGDKEMWNIKLDTKDTFFSHFDNPIIIDLPGYNYDIVQHEKERKLLKSFFDADKTERDSIRKEYNSIAFEHHKKIKKMFLDSLTENHDFVLGYFSIADVIGHLSFGNRIMMKMIYRELDEIAKQCKDTLIVLSDHGMTTVGMFGDHSKYGFWSTNFSDLGIPKITDFANIIVSLGGEKK